jgi:hypothetical protein
VRDGGVDKKRSDAGKEHEFSGIAENGMRYPSIKGIFIIPDILESTGERVLL